MTDPTDSTGPTGPSRLVAGADGDLVLELATRQLAGQWPPVITVSGRDLRRIASQRYYVGLVNGSLILTYALVDAGLIAQDALGNHAPTTALDTLVTSLAAHLETRPAAIPA